MNYADKKDLCRFRAPLALILLLITGLALLPSIAVQCGSVSWLRWFLWHSRREEALSKIWMFLDISKDVQKLPGRMIGLRMEMPEYPVVDIEFAYYTMNYFLYPRRAVVGPPVWPVQSGHDILELLVRQRDPGFVWDPEVESVVTFFSEKDGPWGYEMSSATPAGVPE